MRNRMLKRAAVFLIGATALATAAPAAVAAPAPAPAAVAAKAPTRSMPRQHARSNAAPAASGVAATPVFLTPGQSLQPGQNMTSGDTTLVMQTDGNLVLYLVGPTGQHVLPLWGTNTYGNNGAYAVMQNDGNFVLYRQGGGATTGGALWNSGTWGHSGVYAALVDGDLMLGNDSATQPLWQTRTGFVPTQVNGQYTDNPSDTLASNTGLPGGTWVESNTTWLVMQADGNLVLYRKSDGAALWSTGTWNHPGMVAVMDSQGALDIYGDNQIIWSTRTWNSPGAYAKVQDDGNVVVYQQNGGPSTGGALWQSGTWGKA
ncbi:hypothetical protein ACIGXM_21650 [Kitasatospora sp. NPDC052896]|uniref:hypothetical protein n=1 Tax=Kitasatospora sp. NPDC052896 TaxID=3364061 RepID=UPI0037CA6752